MLICSTNLYGRDHAGVALQHGDGRGGRRAPDSHALVAASRRHEAVVVTDGDVGYLGGVSSDRHQEAPRDDAPDLHQVIVGALDGNNIHFMARLIIKLQL